MGMHSNAFGALSTQTSHSIKGIEAKSSIRAARQPSTENPAIPGAVEIRVLVGGKPAIITFPRPQPPPSPRPRPRPGPVAPGPPPGVPTPPPTPRRPANGISLSKEEGDLGSRPGFITFPRPQPPPSPRPRPRPGPVAPGPPPGVPTPPPTPRR
ncbi:hypothetical protein J7T55_011447 [Diaporthe amygdali]|uniref:uncharacterized protein n=1 Tax=Phomopsis amygdali TaxID=1214568 RepID=UPI0022FF27CB|nr:uncharacterized protein J7T55_011447 [Diaporthe amygdali]KAJ0122986.1 hypothetical protein J7T55_011447 [Diaporthe amygdali]